MEATAEINKRLMAHRGYAAAYPENTLPALVAAVEAGARLLEFDVQLTADRVPILLHDPDFQRTGGAPDRIVELEFAATRSMDVGEAQRFGDQFAGLHAPALADVAAQLAEWPEVTAFVELKRHSIEAFGVQAVLDHVMRVLQPVRGQCVMISFNVDVLVKAREDHGMPIGWALRKYDRTHREYAAALGPEYLFCNQLKLPPAALPLWDGPWQWVVYEIVDADAARTLFARGVSIIETMAYPELAQGLREADRPDSKDR
jgi:glycerophosphoryl diester phosphodiesterase